MSHCELHSSILHKPLRESSIGTLQPLSLRTTALLSHYLFPFTPSPLSISSIHTFHPSITSPATSRFLTPLSHYNFRSRFHLEPGRSVNASKQQTNKQTNTQARKHTASIVKRCLLGRPGPPTSARLTKRYRDCYLFVSIGEPRSKRLWFGVDSSQPIMIAPNNLPVTNPLRTDPILLLQGSLVR